MAGLQDNINRLQIIAQENEWTVTFPNDRKGQSAGGVWVHASDLHIDGVKVSTGSGRNLTAAQDDACREWLVANGHVQNQLDPE